MRRVPPLLLVALLACARQPSIEPPPVRFAYLHAPPDRIWNALLSLTMQAGLEPASLDHSSWFLRTQEMPVSDREAEGLDCGHAQNGMRNQSGASRALGTKILVRYGVLLRPAGDSTGILVQVAARVGEPGTEDEAWICVSRGTLERQFVSRLAAAIGAQP
jgi:hypothetical protein